MVEAIGLGGGVLWWGEWWGLTGDGGLVSIEGWCCHASRHDLKTDRGRHSSREGGGRRVLTSYTKSRGRCHVPVVGKDTDEDKRGSGKRRMRQRLRL